MTSASLKPNDVLLVGRLVILDAGQKAVRPHLGIHIWCPWCKKEHLHGWSDPPFHPTTVVHRASDCRSRVAPSGYFVGLDPAHERHNFKLIDQVRIIQSAWDKRTLTGATK